MDVLKYMARDLYIPHHRQTTAGLAKYQNVGHAWGQQGNPIAMDDALRGPENLGSAPGLAIVSEHYGAFGGSQNRSTPERSRVFGAPVEREEALGGTATLLQPSRTHMASLCTTVLYDFRNEAYCRLTIVATSGRPQSMPDLYAAHDANFSAFLFSYMGGFISGVAERDRLAQPARVECRAVWPTQDLSKERSEYSELRKKIDKVLKDLSTHMRSPAEGMMTDSVKLICSEIEAEVSALDAKQGLSTGRRLVDAMDGLDEVMECCQRVHDHLERLTLNLNLNILQGISEQMLELKLAKMTPSMSAVYNSAEAADIKRGACTEGTREAQIKLLLEWADEPSSGRTCWMNGMAGTGKTTIAYTVCTELKSKNQLGASFFCSRTIPECRRVKHIIPSIAYQLARFSLPFRCALSKVLSADIDAHALALNVQYKKLIEDPLAAVKDCLPSDLIVVIDALDECDNEDSKEITRKMAGRLDGHDDARLVLHNLDSAVVRQDIETYMRKELHDIPLTHAQWRSIVDRCGMLFIYAATTCRYIKQEHEMHNLATAVSVIMNSASVPMEQGDESVIDELYKTILDTAFDRSRASQGNKRRMRMVLETAVCAIEPMTKIAMAKILNLDGDTQVDRLLLPFRSVLNVAQKTGLVTTLHASFPDFMLSKTDPVSTTASQDLATRQSRKPAYDSSTVPSRSSTYAHYPLPSCLTARSKTSIGESPSRSHTASYMHVATGPPTSLSANTRVA
ncbi:WD40 repeat-like protein [Rhizoctonia solani]|uniref:WD40 repeat-like protein n=1 Tax=Rhizoctonia solani TaxID=456999 RepID=A0A8H7LYT3_9AGAM|nr:WD40 repeat-like protein [Rhizoctonia solani]